MDQNNMEDYENKIEELKERVGELENNWKRALADYKNLEKRTAEEKEEYAAFSNLVLISQLVPVLDNLELMEKHLEDTGLKMIVKEFKQILSNEGLKEIEAEAKDFDPNTMEAVDMKKGKPNKIIEVTQKGYMLKNKLIRPARVIVGKEE